MAIEARLGRVAIDGVAIAPLINRLPAGGPPSALMTAICIEAARWSGGGDGEGGGREEIDRRDLLLLGRRRRRPRAWPLLSPLFSLRVNIEIRSERAGGRISRLWIQSGRRLVQIIVVHFVYAGLIYPFLIDAYRSTSAPLFILAWRHSTQVEPIRVKRTQ